MDYQFDHERLEVYQVARLFKRQLWALLKRIPPGNADLRDQLKRAARSVTSNIAEGSGKWKIADKVNFYHIARGSAQECAADLDEMVDYEFVTEGETQEAKGTLSRVVAMLVAMIRSLERRGGRDMGTPA